MRILIASWGDFERWRGVKYRFGDQVSVGPSTLPILQKVIRPDWTVVVLSETLGKDFSSHDTLREDITARAREFLDRIGAGRETDILIVPGVGKFEHGGFEGDAMDVYYYALHGLSQLIPTWGDLEVHFDITHGLNYVTFLVHRALRELLGVRALLSETRFIAYNSDPFVPKVTSELGINVIEDTGVEPHPVSEPLPGFDHYLVPFLVEKRLLGELKTSLDAFRFLSREKKRLEAWAGSVVFGLPLLFAEDFLEIPALERSVEEFLDTWEDYVEVSEGSVKRKLALGKDSGVLVKLLYQAKVLEKLQPELPPSVDDLYNLTEDIFRGSTRERIKVELHKIETAAEKYASAGAFPGWMSLRDFFGFATANTNIVPRNFLAHAGLEANATEVKLEEWEIRDVGREARLHTYLRYSPKAKRFVEEITVRALRGD